MAIEVPVTIPEYLEAVFASPDGSQMAVLHAGDMVSSDWKLLQMRMKREVSHPAIRIPYGPILVIAAVAIESLHRFGAVGLLFSGTVIWMIEVVGTNVRREVANQRRLRTKPSQPS